MRSLRAPQLVRAAIVLITIAAWLVASDHCAFAGAVMQPVTKSPVQESCPGHAPQPEKEQNQSDLPCCKSLAATTAPVKISAGYDLSLFVLQSYLTADFAFISGNADAPLAELDTGPPDLRTFAESVLQRSLLAHAPPLLG